MIEPPESRRQVNWDVPRDREIVSKMRSLVRDTLRSWGLSHMADDVVLSASELIGNAILHGEFPVRLSLRIENDMLNLAVDDHGSGRPHLLDATIDATHGRGLAIVAMLSDQWGLHTDPYTTAKTVWCAFRLEPQKNQKEEK
ncbi:ATP-binding protein [Thermopolyspora sp. NPDC052614]|uniref:ATP-binding protein n=1 Tax=Thermopolyspora sp. NPDC052614 TaxID=3155682 RepID=UPI003435DADC